ncbi:MAG TPA: hypothetical protein VMV23_05780 [Candidatus Nanopelagicaceae bacterium]|nr:hypothetical protein [Candidatus Nanopelagicaceae bacterium]
MSQSIEERISSAFEAEYERPRADLRRMLWEPRRSRRGRGAVLVRLGAVVAVAALVGVALSVPRVVGRHPAPGSNSAPKFSSPVPDFGYEVVSTVANLSGRGGTHLVGVEPPGRAAQVLLQLRCQPGRSVGHLPGKDAWAQAEIRSGGTLVGAVGDHSPAKGQAPSTCPHQGGGLSGGAGLAIVAKPTQITITTPPGIRWQAALEVAQTPTSVTPPSAMPQFLGSCPSLQVTWGTEISGNGFGAITLYPGLDSGAGSPHPVSSCHLVARVRMGIYYLGTQTPIAPIPPNQADQTISGALMGDSGPQGSIKATWHWGNWCGPRRAVQAVLFGPTSVVLGEVSGSALPACHPGVSGLDLSPGS